MLKYHDLENADFEITESEIKSQILKRIDEVLPSKASYRYFTENLHKQLLGFNKS